MNQQSLPDFSPMINVAAVMSAKLIFVLFFFGVVSISIMLVMKKKGFRRDVSDMTGRGIAGLLAFPLFWMLVVPAGAPSPLQLVTGVPVTQQQSVNSATYPNMSSVKRYLDRVKLSEECTWHRGEYLRLASNQNIASVIYAAEQHWASVVRNRCAI